MKEKKFKPIELTDFQVLKDPESYGYRMRVMREYIKLPHGYIPPRVAVIKFVELDDIGKLPDDSYIHLDRKDLQKLVDHLFEEGITQTKALSKEDHLQAIFEATKLHLDDIRKKD